MAGRRNGGATVVEGFTVRQPAMVRGMCENYRAAASIDLEHDQASRGAEQKIACPLLALWGARARLRSGMTPLAIWQRYCAAPVTGAAVDSGHYIPEEAPEAALDWFGRFF